MRRGSVLPIAVMAFALVALLVFIDFSIFPEKATTTLNQNAVACSREAKLCPDGSYVGRAGSRCEFSKCPGTIPVLVNVTDPEDVLDWKTYSNSKYNLTFQYPPDWVVKEEATPWPEVEVHPNSSKDNYGEGSVTFWFDVGFSYVCGLGRYPSMNTKYVLLDDQLTLESRVADSQKEYSCPIRTYEFIQSPPGWGSEPSVVIVADASGLYSVQEQILSTLTFIEPTAGWKTYTNSTYGSSGETYSFRYPTNWRINDYDPQYVRLSPPDQNTNENSTPVTISIDYIVVPGAAPPLEIGNPTYVDIGGKTVTEGIVKMTPDVYVAQVQVKGGLLQINWVQNDSSDEIQKQILSTFTFTD